MNLLQELHELIGRYLDRVISVTELEDALADLAIPIAEGGDTEASALGGLVWRLLSEYSYGDRAEPSLRATLRRAVPVRDFVPGLPVSRTLAGGGHIEVSAVYQERQSFTSVRLGAIA